MMSTPDTNARPKASRRKAASPRATRQGKAAAGSAVVPSPAAAATATQTPSAAATRASSASGQRTAARAPTAWRGPATPFAPPPERNPLDRRVHAAIARVRVVILRDRRLGGPVALDQERGRAIVKPDEHLGVLQDLTVDRLDLLDRLAIETPVPRVVSADPIVHPPHVRGHLQRAKGEFADIRHVFHKNVIHDVTMAGSGAFGGEASARL